MQPLSISRPNRSKENTTPRSIDEFYEEAYNSTSIANTSRKASWQQLRYWLIFFTLGIANSGDATEIGSMNFILSNERFKEEMLMGDLKKRGAMLASAIFMGMLIGGIVTGSYGDRLGRRPSLLTGLVLNTVAGFSAALSPNIGALIFCRFFGGIGIGSILASLPTLAAETSCPSRRGFFVTFVSSFYTAGSVFSAVSALYMFGRNDVHWRVFVGVSAMPCLMGAIMVYLFVPESARYLASDGRVMEAAKVANEVANSMGFRGAALEVDEVRYHFEKNDPANPNMPAAIGHAELYKKKTFARTTREAKKNITDLYSRSVWLKTVTLQLLWFSLSFGSGLNTWINTIYKQINIDDVYVAALYFNLSNLPGVMLAAYLLDRWGRKKLMSFSMILSSVSLIFFALEAKDTENNAFGVILTSCAYHAFLVSGWCTINVMTSEYFPTKIRATGIGMCAANGRIGAMLVQYVNGSLVDQPAVMIMVTSVCLFLGAFVPFLIPAADMAQKPLEDQIEQELPIISKTDNSIREIA